jgi:ubiquinone/menaquinone biosynthesis C-methylase UbiE
MIVLTGVRADQSLLDIGAGAGWPALYVARETGCHATLVDIPMNALQQAMERAVEDQTSARVDAVAASGAALPFDDDSFDIVTHSDVLCCLPEKLEMLRECRRVLRSRSTRSTQGFSSGKSCSQWRPEGSRRPLGPGLVLH